MATAKQGYQLTAIKHHKGMEGYGLNANITLDGKKIGEVLDEGSGGCPFFTFPSRTDREAFEAHCMAWWKSEGCKQRQEGMNEWAERNKVSPVVYEEESTHGVMEYWVSEQETAAQVEKERKKLDKMALTKTLFRVNDQKYREGEWTVLNQPYGPKVQEWLDKKYPGKITEIYGVLTLGPASCVLPAETESRSAA